MKPTLQQVIDKYGVPNQLDMVTEECAELIQAINKVKRNKQITQTEILKPTKLTSNKKALAYYNLCSEVADVKIMIAQLELLLDNEAINLSMERKIERLQNRLNK